MLALADNTGVKKMMVIHIYGGSKRRHGYLGDIVACTVKIAIPDAQFKKSAKVKAVVVRTRKEQRRSDGTYVRFQDNAGVIIDNEKSKSPLGTRIFGPIAREVKERGFTKIASLAQNVV